MPQRGGEGVARGAKPSVRADAEAVANAFHESFDLFDEGDPLGMEEVLNDQSTL